MGLTGLQVGTDYSGNKVYGDITQVPGTAWYMISKIQKQELFQDLRTKSILILIVIVLGLLSIFSSISWIYQIRQKAIAGELRIRNEELQKSREDIVKLNQDLERQVRERTMELETKVEMLRQGEKEMLLVVDDLNKMTSELSQERNKLEVTNRELEAFSYSVSHDLRAPLRGIDGFTGILLSEYGDQLDEEGKRLCAIIKNNARSMGQLIDDLLAFSRLARHEIIHEKIDMERMFYSVFTGITGNLEKESIDFHMDSLEDCVGDKALIRQVVVNLLSNAIKFTSKTDKPRIEVSCQRKDQHIVYFVRDNGAGFDMQYSDKLFGVFQRLHTVAEFDGTGVGLANVKRIVTRHGGEVGASGEVNKGANFWFSLPFQA
jgi:signal transduction histidine kinase